MTRRLALLACTALALPLLADGGVLDVSGHREASSLSFRGRAGLHGLLAQPAAGDPVTGAWAAEGRTLLDLRLEPGGVVSGTVLAVQEGATYPTPIARGSFDAGARRIRLAGEVVRPGSPRVDFVIEGVVEQDALAVEYRFGENAGVRRLVRLAAQSRPSAAAPGVVLVTGSNRGLGLEFARQYAARGWTVVATARNPDGAADLRDLAAKNGRVAIEKLDVVNAADLKALAAKYKGRPIDLVINNAGVLGDLDAQALGSLDAAQFEEVMAVNVYGALAVSEAFRDNVAASGHKKIVAITSGSGILSRPGVRGPYFYNASKAALNMVMRILSNDLRARGVIVGIVAPGVADTDMRREVVGAEQASREPTAAEAVASMIEVIDGLTLEQSGLPLNVDGTPLPW